MAKLFFLIDPENDFIHGTLPVPLADEAMDNCAIYIDRTNGIYDAKVVSIDFHPSNHCSFEENGGQWKAHCLAHTNGAAIWKALERPLLTTHGETFFLTKGTNPHEEEYSLFKNIESAFKFKEIVEHFSITEIDICGIVREICVLDTLKDLHEIYPNMKVNVILQYTPTMDSGVTFAKYMEENRDWLNTI